jgi:hypothetical protein
MILSASVVFGFRFPGDFPFPATCSNCGHKRALWSSTSIDGVQPPSGLSQLASTMANTASAIPWDVQDGSIPTGCPWCYRSRIRVFGCRPLQIESHLNLHPSGPAGLDFLLHGEPHSVATCSLPLRLCLLCSGVKVRSRAAILLQADAHVHSPHGSECSCWNQSRRHNATPRRRSMRSDSENLLQFGVVVVRYAQQICLCSHCEPSALIGSSTTH